MISRDTLVHVVAVLLAIAVLAGASALDVVGESSPLWLVVFVLFYGLAIGGAHLYLAVRGEDGMVPVRSRWRFLAMLAVVFGVGALLWYAGDRSVGPVDVQTIGLGVAFLAVLAFFLAESIDGYRSSRAGDGA